MNSEQREERQRKQLKLAEGGILFVVILALTILVGVRFAGDGPDDATPDVAAVTDGTGADGSARAATFEDHGSTDVAGTTEAVAEVAVADGGNATVTPTADGDETAPVTGDTDARDAAVEKAARRAPHAVSYARAEGAYLAGRYADAAGLFEAYTADHPENAWGFYMLGLSYWKDGACDAAEAALRDALALRPDHLKSKINLGRVLLAQDRAADALPFLEEAVAAAPDNVAAYRVLGRIYHELGQCEEAQQAYGSALQRDRTDAWSANNLALLLIEEERFAAALPAAALAVQLRPENAVFQNNLAVALERTGRPAAAAAAFAAAVDADAGHDRAVASLERLANLGIEPAEGTLDLAALAASFDPAADTGVAPADEPADDLASLLPEPDAPASGTSSGDER
jgi:predicted Zn-dependent protease